MAKAKQLRMGVDSPSTSPNEKQERIAVLRATIETYLPKFVKVVAVASSKAKDAKDNIVMLHQDAFAAGYDDDEYTLLGMAIKYAGLHGLTVTLIGKNHETF